MKRKWLIMGDERKFMTEVFELNDQQVNQVQIFMEQEFHSIPEFVKLLIKSNLNSNQKMLASYIMGNTVGFSTVQMKQDLEEGRANIDPRVAG